MSRWDRLAVRHDTSLAGVNGAHLRQPSLEQAPLGVVADQRKCTAVSVSGLFRSADTAQKLAPRRVQIVVVIECEAIDDDEPLLGTFCFGNGDCPVQFDNR